ncbi:flagellar motor protein MotB [Ancylomarina euxinus]|uniref:Flagellar motor protein MotB n=1 Tax=Ancylomarina euxinus TaxID=2283627 RepID=A0A425Y8X9_9BACT|nr:OmpA family protein [Ancylomarina euxinus]MCZ4693340.1 OmpA family protein [Ancylomarina euxinus]MUP13568.1 OmpA family protein [Ancylomarina euxinus]RRG24784.1 flagellar motor protein MotB [Ancylomarina euxinus]
MKRIKQFLVVLATGSVLFSCVPARQYQNLESWANENQKKYEELKDANRLLIENNTELEGQLEVLEDKYKRADEEYKESSERLFKSKEQLKRCEVNQEDLLAQLAKQQKGSAKEAKALLDLIHKTQDNLNLREDEIMSLEQDLKRRIIKLDDLQNEINRRDKRLLELESALAKKDKAVIDLKNKVMNALTGFDNKGLSISNRNGKVYVSMDEKLLFKSGSYTVDVRGAQALKQLAQVLSTNKDINIVIEGHTDNVPYKGSGDLKDNWDLSVKRATSIVRILIMNKGIDPQRMTVAGRSKYLPIVTNASVEGRSKNRRTEIILTPKLDELFQILGQ